MSRVTQAVIGHRPVRCLVVWLAVTVAVGVGVLAVREELAAAVAGGWGALTFDDLLVRGTTVVAALAGAWIWLVTTITVVEAASGLGRPTITSGRVRRLVLAACGVALASGAVTAPAAATPGHNDPPTSSVQDRLGGLPLPDRASIDDSPGPAPRSAAPDPAPTRRVAQLTPPDTGSVVVRTGDSLWSIAAATLPAGADEQRVDRRWREIYAANRAAIGSDPDVIQPGVRLTLPPA